MDKRHRKLNSELNEELIQRRVKMEDFESFLDEIIKKAETKLNTFASPEKENRQTQTPETVKRKFFHIKIMMVHPNLFVVHKSWHFRGRKKLTYKSLELRE